MIRHDINPSHKQQLPPLVIIIWIILRLEVTQGSSKGFSFPNGLEISWTFLFHMSKAFTTEAFWSEGNNVLTAVPSILFPFILALKLWKTGLLSVLVKSFCIGIFYELFELPSDVGFHFRIFIIRRLIDVTAVGLQYHALALAWFHDPRQTQFIGLQVANQLCQRNLINVSWHGIFLEEIWALFSQSWVREWFPQD